MLFVLGGLDFLFEVGNFIHKPFHLLLPVRGFYHRPTDLGEFRFDVLDIFLNSFPFGTSGRDVGLYIHIIAVCTLALFFHHLKTAFETQDFFSGFLNIFFPVLAKGLFHKFEMEVVKKPVLSLLLGHIPQRRLVHTLETHA